MHSKPQREELASSQLARQGFEVFLPRMRVQARRRGRFVEPGSAVRVTEGLLEGYRGIVQAKSGRERVEILLDIAGKRATATLSPHQVTPA